MSDAALGLLVVVTLVAVIASSVLGYILGFEHGREPNGDRLSCLNCGDEIDEMDIPHYCGACGSRLQVVRPGKWQCPKCE